MQRHNKKRQKAEEISTTDEILVKQYEIELLHEQLEFSREQIETLNLQLGYKEQELEQIEQELTHTNRDLSNAVIFQKVEYGEARQLAQKILNSNKSASESLAQLLTAIYGCATPPEELEHLDSLSIITNSSTSAETDQIVARLKEVKARSKQLYSQYKDLHFQFANLKNTFVKVKARSKQLYSQYKDLHFQFANSKNTFVKMSEIYTNLRTETKGIFKNHVDKKDLNSSPPPDFF